MCFGEIGNRKWESLSEIEWQREDFGPPLLREAVGVYIYRKQEGKLLEKVSVE